MDEIIKGKSVSHQKYGELLLKRDSLRKEAIHWKLEHTRVFGKRIILLFQKKMECIRLKKSIEYCQRFINRGLNVSEIELSNFIKREMKRFYEQLEELKKEKENADSGKPVTEKELLEIKRIYRRLAKRIHPDINPKAMDSELIMDLWNRILIDYNCNNLAGLQEDEVLVNAALDEMDFSQDNVDIPDIEIRIELLEGDIRNIIETDPYQYRFLLEDPELIREKENQLDNDIRDYEEYEKTLRTILDDLMRKGVTPGCRMN